MLKLFLYEGTSQWNSVACNFKCQSCVNRTVSLQSLHDVTKLFFSFPVVVNEKTFLTEK